MASVTEDNPERKFRKGDPCPLVEDGEACGKPIFVEMHGWCSMHYGRYRTHGNPLHRTRRYVRQGEKCTYAGGCDEKPKMYNLCGKHSARLAKHGETTDPRERRFWAKVDTSGGPDACWPWTGFVGENGYGQFGSKGKGTSLVHRIAYQYLVGPIPEGKMLDRLCHTRDPLCPGGACVHRKCANPSHAQPVGARENIARGRGGDSWGYVPAPVPARHEQLAFPFCPCGGPKPIYKSGKCRPCYKKWLKDPSVRRPRSRTVEERFWEKVDKKGPPPYERLDLGPCWAWTASINKHTGYGRFGVKHGEMWDAHRYSYLMAHGSIPEKHDVHHMCLRRACVNPAHLEAVTRSQNLAERMNRRSR